MKNRLAIRYLLYTILLILSISLFIPLPVEKINAASSYKWDDKNHDSLTGPSGTKYKAIGYACLIIFKSDGTLDESKGAYPEGSDKDIQVSYSNEAYSGVSTVPSCKDGQPANYVWIASDKKSAVVVKGNQDNKLVGIGAPYRGEASLWLIDSSGNTKFKANITEIEKPNDNGAPETEQTKKGAEDAQSDETTSKACWQAIPVFGWILCPILDFANTLYNWMFGIVRNLLFIPEASYNSNAGLKESWNNMKNIASAIIVLVALVMIAAQIFNFEFVSAYTMKKALPRLVIAAIAIQLSWYIFTLLIQITNGVGAGIYNLLTLPFNNAGDILTDLGNQNDAVGTGSQSFGGLLIFLGLSAGAVSALLTALTPGGWMTLVLVSIGVIVSMLVALITLIVRKMLIITLLILSPVALALWILPGTQRVWSMWWQLFSKLLLMFPLIMILFAAGQIFAASLSNIDESGIVGSVNMIMIIVAFFAPLFLIPGTFKAAGGIFGQISGAINGLGKKASGADWGLRRKRDAYRKVSDEIRASERAHQTREAASRALSPDSNTFQKLRGRATIGGAALLPGKKGRAAMTKYQNLYAARADDAAMKDAKEELSNALSGMAFDNDKTEPANKSQVKSALALATAKAGEKVNVNGREITATPELSRASAEFLANTARSDHMRMVQEALESDSRGPEGKQLWNTIVNENAGKIAAMNPDQVKKDWHKLDASQMATMDAASWRNMKADMAAMEARRQDAISSGKTAEAQDLSQKLNTIMATVDIATKSDATRAMVTGEKLMHAKGIVAGPQGWGATLDSSGQAIDYQGRSRGDSGYHLP